MGQSHSVFSLLRATTLRLSQLERETVQVTTSHALEPFLRAICLGQKKCFPYGEEERKRKRIKTETGSVKRATRGR